MKSHIFLAGDIKANKSVILGKQIPVCSEADVVVIVENSGSITRNQILVNSDPI